MDIEKLKKDADNRYKYRKETENIIVEINNLLGELYVLQNEIHTICLNKIELMKNILKVQFTEYFTETEFMIEKQEDTITAIYKDLIINLIHKGENIFQFNIPIENIYETIKIDIERKSSEMLSCKNLLRYNGECISVNNFTSLASEIKEFEEFLVLKKNIEENIAHYRTTIKEKERIKYIFYLYVAHKECDNFKDIFQKYINP